MGVGSPPKCVGHITAATFVSLLLGRDATAVEGQRLSAYNHQALPHLVRHGLHLWLRWEVLAKADGGATAAEESDGANWIKDKK